MDSTITINLTNVNEGPVAVADTATAVEAGGTANGTAGTNPTGNVLTNDTDVDAGDTKTVSGVAVGVVGSASTNVGSSVTGAYGAFILLADGSYTYTVDNANAAVQALRTSGNTLSDVFTYTMRDTAGLTSTTQITVTIQGANDAPVGVNDTATAVEAGGTANGTAGTNPTGNVLTNDTDVDSSGNGETKAVNAVAAGAQASATGGVATSVTGTYGSINIAADGSYTYTVDNTNSAVQALRTTANTLNDVFTYRVVDAGGLSSLATITVTIQGANDAPVAVADSGTAVEAGGAQWASSVIAYSTAYGGLSGQWGAQQVLGAPNTLTYGDVPTAWSPSSASGTLDYITVGYANAVYANGITVRETCGNGFVYQLDVLDNLGVYHTVWTGTDPSQPGAPVDFFVSIPQTSYLVVGVKVYINTQLNGGNYDEIDAIRLHGIASVGTNPIGNVLTNDTDVDSVGSGETKTVSGVAAGSVGSAAGSVGVSVTGTYGSMNIAADGSYTYSVDNSNSAVQSLRTSSNTLSDVYSYTVTDTGGLTSTTQVTITIQGANDAPVAVNDTATAVEAGGLNNATSGTNPTGNVLTNDTDVDSGDNQTVTAVVSGARQTASGGVATNVTGVYGSINIAANGSYTYTVDNSNASVQALRTAAQTLTDVFTYQMMDAGGLPSLATITVTIQGANDTPTAVADTATAIEAGGTANGTTGTNPTGNVLTNDTDQDSVANGETKTVSGVAAGVVGSASTNVGSAVTGSYGSITINANGTYSYTVDNTNAAVQALRTISQTLSDVFTYSMVDAGGLTSTTQITVTIQGANDAPVGVNDTATAVETGGTANGTAGTNRRVMC